MAALAKFPMPNLKPDLQTRKTTIEIDSRLADLDTLHNCLRVRLRTYVYGGEKRSTDPVREMLIAYRDEVMRFVEDM